MLRFPAYMSSSMLLATLNFFLFIMLHIRCPVFGLILRLLPYALACFSSGANVYGIFITLTSGLPPCLSAWLLCRATSALPGPAQGRTPQACVPASPLLCQLKSIPFHCRWLSCYPPSPGLYPCRGDGG